MEYIAQTESDSPRTRCAKSDESQSICYKYKAPNIRMPPPKETKNWNYMTSRHSNGCLHQSWKPKANGMWFDDSHKNESRFTFSRMIWGSITAFFNI